MALSQNTAKRCLKCTLDCFSNLSSEALRDNNYWRLLQQSFIKLGNNWCLTLDYGLLTKRFERWFMQQNQLSILCADPRSMPSVSSVSFKSFCSFPPFSCHSPSLSLFFSLSQFLCSSHTFSVSLSLCLFYSHFVCLFLSLSLFLPLCLPLFISICPYLFFLYLFLLLASSVFQSHFLYLSLSFSLVYFLPFLIFLLMPLLDYILLLWSSSWL